MGHDTTDPDGTRMRNPPAAGQAGDQASPDTGTGGGGENRSFQGDSDHAADGQRIDTDGDGRTREPGDTRPTDDSGRGAPVSR